MNNQNSEAIDFSDSNESEQIEFINPPILTWTWVDHERKCKFVNLAFPIFSGAEDIKFELSDSGDVVTITFKWPLPIQNPDDLFANEINNGTITIDHPKVHALKSKLLNLGFTKKCCPRGKIVISLPMKVQKEEEFWKIQPIKRENGTRIALLEFKGFQDKPHTRDADTSITFD